MNRHSKGWVSVGAFKQAVLMAGLVVLAWGAPGCSKDEDSESSTTSQLKLGSDGEKPTGGAEALPTIGDSAGTSATKPEPTAAPKADQDAGPSALDGMASPQTATGDAPKGAKDAAPSPAAGLDAKAADAVKNAPTPDGVPADALGDTTTASDSVSVTNEDTATGNAKDVGGAQNSKEEATGAPDAAATDTQAVAADASAPVIDPKAAAMGAAPKVGEPQAAPDSPGIAWFALGADGLVRLRDGKFERGPGKKLGMVKDVAFGPKGDLVVASSRGIFRVSKSRNTATKIGSYRDPGAASAVAIDAGGNIWAVGFRGVFSYDGKRWSTVEKALLGSGVKLLQDVAVDEAGQIWVLSSGGIHRRTDDRWISEYDIGERLFFRNMDIGKTLIFAHSKGLLRLTKGTVEPWRLNKLGRSSIGQMAALNDGGVVVRAFGGITVVRGDGKTRRYSDKFDSFAGRKVEAVATDASGRVWVSTDHGVAIIGADDAVTVWPPGAIPTLAGEVRGIYVEAGGPALPKVGDVQRGILTGKVMRAGKVVPGATVEVCRRPDTMFGTTPCSKAPFSLSTKTNATGEFKFAAVPVGAYRFAVTAGGPWTTTQIPCCQGMKAEKVHDVGAIELK